MKSLSSPKRLSLQNPSVKSWPVQGFVCRRCMHALTARTTTGTHGEQVNLQSKSKRQGQGRLQHTSSTKADSQLAQNDFLRTLLIQGKSEVNTQSTQQPPTEKPPPNSKIRQLLRQWEKDQQATDTQAEVGAGLSQFLRHINAGDDMSRMQDDPFHRLDGKEEDDPTAYDHRSTAGADAGPDFIGAKTDFQPGDICTFPNRSNSYFDYLAVCVQRIEDQYHFYDLSGKYVVRPEKFAGNILQPMRGIIDPKLVEPIIPHLPTEPLPIDDENIAGSVPREAAQPVFEILSKFSQEALEFYQMHRRALDNIYEDLSDHVQKRFLSLDQICQEVVKSSYNDLESPQQFAVHTCLRHIGIKTMRYSRDARGVYAFRPSSSVARLRKVIEWARLYQEAAARASQSSKTRDPAPDNPLYSFITKARQLILKSRESRKPTTTGTLGPSLTHPPNGVEEEPGESFTTQEQMILELLDVCYAEVPTHNDPHLHSVGSTILRASGAYPKMELDKNAGYMLLQELGVFAPWTNIRLRSWAMNLADTGADSITDELYQQCMSPEYEEHVHGLADRMSDIREDLGDLPVFSCDSVTTTEVDDAFSIKSVPGVPDQKWLHIHIADPSAFLSLDEPVAKFAGRVLATTYTVEHHVKMLPTPAIIDRFSLAPNRPAMTISALLTADGRLKDVRIRPTTVRNVIKLTPEQLTREFWYPDEQQDLLTVGKKTTSVPPLEDDTWKKHLSDFKTVIDYLAAHLQHKREHPNFIPARRGLVRQIVSVHVENAKYKKVDFSHSRQLQGDPTISLVTSSSPFRKNYWEYSSVEIVSENPIAEMMQVAGEAAALWCQQRGIPIVYAGTKEAHGWPVAKIQHYLREKIEANFSSAWPTAAYSSAPAFHHSIGVEQYARVTSPLRRYHDLLSHWQINSYLRNQADGKITGIDSVSQKDLQFTKKEVDECLIETAGREFRMRRLSKVDSYHWKLLALFRAFYFKEAELPEKLDAKVYHVVKGRTEDAATVVEGMLDQYQCMCVFEPSEAGYEKEAEVGDVFEVKINKINPNLWGSIYVGALGPAVTGAQK